LVVNLRDSFNDSRLEAVVKGFHEPDLCVSVLTYIAVSFYYYYGRLAATGHVGVDGRQDARLGRIGKLKSLLQIFLNN